ncbi:hypothetical protein GC175_18325 [bacterium]|nr:hypothetical protein [bacterium]
MELSVKEMIVLTIAAIGTLFIIVSAIGVLRLPDVLSRMHALGKAATLGIAGLLFSAGVFFFEDGTVFLRMIVLIVLYFITAPVASTIMGRAAYRSLNKEDLGLNFDQMGPSQAPAQNPPSTAEGRTI